MEGEKEQTIALLKAHEYNPIDSGGSFLNIGMQGAVQNRGNHLKIEGLGWAL